MEQECSVSMHIVREKATPRGGVSIYTRNITSQSVIKTIAQECDKEGREPDATSGCPGIIWEFDPLPAFACHHDMVLLEV